MKRSSWIVLAVVGGLFAFGLVFVVAVLGWFVTAKAHRAEAVAVEDRYRAEVQLAQAEAERAQDEAMEDMLSAQEQSESPPVVWDTPTRVPVQVQVDNLREQVQHLEARIRELEASLADQAGE